jgi:hypothetical protein
MVQSSRSTATVFPSRLPALTRAEAGRGEDPWRAIRRVAGPATAARTRPASGREIDPTSLLLRLDRSPWTQCRALACRSGERRAWTNDNKKASSRGGPASGRRCPAGRPAVPQAGRETAAPLPSPFDGLTPAERSCTLTPYARVGRGYSRINRICPE